MPLDTKKQLKLNVVSPNICLDNLALFKEWKRMKHEIMVHKWIESEKVGYDIGWDRASMDWMKRHSMRR